MLYLTLFIYFFFGILPLMIPLFYILADIVFIKAEFAQMKETLMQGLLINKK